VEGNFRRRRNGKEGPCLIGGGREADTMDGERDLRPNERKILGVWDGNTPKGGLLLSMGGCRRGEIG